MIVDLHNHTTLCNHAEGKMHEYVEKAIKGGTKYFGFSDHAPMKFDEKYRMDFSQMQFYQDSVLKLKERFRDDIEILLGYEVDFLDGYMDERVLKSDVDYLIGSVHFIDKWGFDNPEFIGDYEKKDIDEIWRDYFACIADMAKSGHFDIVGHFDLIKVFRFLPKTDILSLAKEALLHIKKADMVLEINSAGFRKPIGEAYPSKEILKEAFRLKIPITFGSDAHKPSQVGENSDEIVKLAREVGYRECAIFHKRQRSFVEF